MQVVPAHRTDIFWCFILISVKQKHKYKYKFGVKSFLSKPIILTGQKKKVKYLFLVLNKRKNKTR